MPTDDAFTRRDFVKTSAALTAAALAGSTFAQSQQRNGDNSRRIIRVGVIGCGGRGTGAALNALDASPFVRITALADVFDDRLRSARSQLAGLGDGKGDRAKVADDHCFSGFDAYNQLLATDVDVVILATPPHFRPIHLAAAIDAGKHVFMEKPVAVDGPGVRSVIASAEAASTKRLSIVAGTQRRHETSYNQTIARLKDGGIGRIVSARCYWNQGGLWMNERQPAWTDMEWQLRNWLYFTWLSGDHIVEQHVHNLDVINWVLGSTPLRATGMGGRQVRTNPAYGHVFDHFAIEYEYPDDVHVLSMCRQIDGCASKVEEVFHGSTGRCTLSPGRGVIDSDKAWRFTSDNNNPYLQEHIALMQAVLTDTPINEGRQVAESTLTAIMGRMSAYTGKVVTWEQALNSKEELRPERYEMGELPVAPVPVPGRTPLL